MTDVTTKKRRTNNSESRSSFSSRSIPRSTHPSKRRVAAASPVLLAADPNLPNTSTPTASRVATASPVLLAADPNLPVTSTPNASEPHCSPNPYIPKNMKSQPDTQQINECHATSPSPNIQENEVYLKVKRLTPYAFLPQRHSLLSAGFDLVAAHSRLIPAEDRLSVPTDIFIELPAGTYGRIAPRSGLAARAHIGIGGGVIDSSRGIDVIMFNHAKHPYAVARGDRIAQLILEQNILPQIIETTNLSKTHRGDFGFGSTGKR